MNNLETRGTGRTTKQLEAMPQGGVFVSCNNQSKFYDTALAKLLNRLDIKIVSPEWISNECWQGRVFSALEVDHAYPPRGRTTDRFYQQLHRARTRIRISK